MTTSIDCWRWCVGTIVVTLLSPGLGSIEAQQPVAKAAQTPAAVTSASPASGSLTAPSLPTRRLAPGVLIAIKPEEQITESFSRDDIVELLAVDPKLKFAENITFRRDIWALSFQFKPMRMVVVDIPQPSGKMQRKQIWYLVYAVTNPGKALHPVPAKSWEQIQNLEHLLNPSKGEDAGMPKEAGVEEGTHRIQGVDMPIRFVPDFILESWKASDPKYHKYYPDRVIPKAVAAIQRREDPSRTLYNSVEMDRTIQPGETVWGVATWVNVDPRTDRFSLYCYGLTNSYSWKDDPKRVQASASPEERVAAGRKWYRKALKINFWRPGDDEIREVEVRYGIPGEPDYIWLNAEQDPLPHPRG